VGRISEVDVPYGWITNTGAEQISYGVDFADKPYNGCACADDGKIDRGRSPDSNLAAN